MCPIGVWNELRVANGFPFCAALSLTMHLHDKAKMRNDVLALFTVTAVLLTCTRAANPPPAVTVRKCCPFGQELRVEEHLATDSVLDAVACIPSNASDWLPKIKYKKRPGFFEGGKPKFMTFVPNQLPLATCTEPMHSRGPHSVILVTDGSLIVNDRSLVIPENERFCVDRESAIYCLPETDSLPTPKETGASGSPVADLSVGKWQRRRTTVRKCCGQGFAYSSVDKTCVHLGNSSHPLNGKPVFDHSALQKTRLDLLYGFPTSCRNANFAILGTFDQTRFDEEKNVLRLENSDRELQESEFCLEHMFGQGEDTLSGSFVTVFTCAEFFPVSGNQPEQNEIPRDYRYVVYSVGLIISLIFLIATLVISFLVPSNHHALHWRCQTYYVACLLVGDFFLAITQLAGDSILQPYCSIFGESREGGSAWR